MVLSNEIKQAITTSVTSNSTVERSDKELFLLAYKEYKAQPAKSRGHITSLMNKEVEVVTKSINVQNTLKRVFKLAFNYVDMQVVCKFDNLEYSNIANLVKLFKYVDKNVSDSSKTLREEVKALYKEDMSPYRYNNVVAEKITQLKEKYKLVDTEGEFVFKDFVNTFKGAMSRMTDEQLLEIEAMIADRLHSSEVEVA